MCKQQRDLWFGFNQCNFNVNRPEISSQQLNKLWHWVQTCQQRHNPIYYWLINQLISFQLRHLQNSYFSIQMVCACTELLVFAVMGGSKNGEKKEKKIDTWIIEEHPLTMLARSLIPDLCPFWYCRVSPGSDPLGAHICEIHTSLCFRNSYLRGHWPSSFPSVVLFFLVTTRHSMLHDLHL